MHLQGSIRHHFDTSTLNVTFDIFPTLHQMSIRPCSLTLDLFNLLTQCLDMAWKKKSLDSHCLICEKNVLSKTLYTSFLNKTRLETPFKKVLALYFCNLLYSQSSLSEYYVFILHVYVCVCLSEWSILVNFGSLFDH